jgi:Uma2 family endonuclease
MSMPSTNEQPARRYLRAPRAIDFPTEAEVPETRQHLDLRTALYTILRLALRTQATIGSEQFVYWDPTDPCECLAPDAFVRLGAPDEQFDSWKVWERGAPQVAVEIVSGSDASEAIWTPKLAKYHRLGVREVVRFDPDGCTLRIWDQVEGDLVERALVDGQPAECVPLGLFWVVAPDDASGVLVRLAHDKAGKDLLPTLEETAEIAQAKSEAAQAKSEAERETARAESKTARAESEAARAERDAALERVRVLEAELAKRR